MPALPGIQNKLGFFLEVFNFRQIACSLSLPINVHEKNILYLTIYYINKWKLKLDINIILMKSLTMVIT